MGNKADGRMDETELTRRGDVTNGRHGRYSHQLGRSKKYTFHFCHFSEGVTEVSCTPTGFIGMAPFHSHACYSARTGIPS